MWRFAVAFFYICAYDVFYVVFIVLFCDYFVRNDEINEHIYIYIYKNPEYHPVL